MRDPVTATAIAAPDRARIARLLAGAIASMVLLAAPHALAGEPAPIASTHPGESRDASAVAARFLELLDGGQYGSSWETTGAHLRRLGSRPMWATTIASMRADTGPIAARKPLRATFTRLVENAPPGHYYLVVFDSRFERATMEEKVLLNLESGQWRVEGYTMDRPRKPATGRKAPPH